MVNYEFLKAMPQDHFIEMVRRGIIPITVMDYLTVYEFYLNELKSKTKVGALNSSAEYFNCSDKTIYNIINFMKK
jgi:hypothetical protein